MTRAFISHAFGEADKRLALELRDALGEARIDGYLAEKSPQYTRLVHDKIREAIEESDWVVAIITRAAQSSASVHEEIGYALGKGKRVIVMREKGVKESGVLIYGMEPEVFNADGFGRHARRVAKFIADADASDIKVYVVDNDPSLEALLAIETAAREAGTGPETAAREAGPAAPWPGLASRLHALNPGEAAALRAAASPHSLPGPAAVRLLAGRRILSARDEDFGLNRHHAALYGGAAAAGADKPAVLFTACPHDLGGYDVAPGALLGWVQGTRHVMVGGHRIPVRESEPRTGPGSLTLVALHPRAPPGRNVLSYREFLGAGLLECGASHPYLGRNALNGLSLHLCRVIGDFWGFLLYACLFYQRIGMDGPFTALLSVRNSSSLALGNYGEEVLSPGWNLSARSSLGGIEARTGQRHIRLPYRFASVEKTTYTAAAGAARDAAHRICGVYGQRTPGCYDGSGRFAWRLWEAVSR